MQIPVKISSLHPEPTRIVLKLLITLNIQKGKSELIVYNLLFLLFMIFLI